MAADELYQAKGNTGYQQEDGQTYHGGHIEADLC
jgi:hypothetical protein